MWDRVVEAIERATGTAFYKAQYRPVGGGCIHQAYRVTDGERTFFVKCHAVVQVEMFAAEQAALEELDATRTIRVPKPIVVGTAGDIAYLVLEWLDLDGPPNWTLLGERLALLHRTLAPHGYGYGWHCTNAIGATPQPNPWTAEWVDFWARYRLGFQLELARRKGFNTGSGEKLLALLPDFFVDYRPQPSLVHGDLWSGNVAFTPAGEPVIFDPALYWADREVDLAMTELFGGFAAPFYRAYEQVYPLDPGYPRRKTLYNLYHVLNHFNLFGGGYGAQAERMIEALLRSI
ncbi:fructosamine kinase family protein [Anthocerotibacter panamensis]|uniref:fructosamine kinase family protein n=1 Tax=Anthocerotibacter panamensis TaxID=2857077 RepID=UPI001C405EAE|nr:fructosamine kinase family protein [Anthocerotibacter panamensis]